jgi:PAS domain S-box-containing protein
VKDESPPVEHLLELEKLMGAATWRRDDRGIWASPRLFELFGIEGPIDEPLQRFQEELLPRVHADDVESLSEFVERLELESESSVEFRATIHGEERVFAAKATNLNGAQTGIVRDITTQRSVERAKNAAEARFQTLAEALPVGIYMGTPTGEPRYANRAFLDMYAIESLEELDWDKLLHPDEREELEAHHELFLQTGQWEPKRFRILPKGKTRLVESRLAFVDNDTRDLIIAIVVDHTDQRRREIGFIESQRELAWSQNISRTATWRLMLKPHRIIWSEELYRMLGRDPETFQVTEKSFVEHVAEGWREESDRITKNAMANLETWDHVVELDTGDGRRIWARSIGEPVIGSEGELVGVRGLIQDITEMKHLEDRVRRAEKFQALGELAGGIAHDVNNMLAAILGNAELLATDLTGEALLDCREIIQTSRRCGDLTNQLLAFSRRRPLESKEVDLSQSIETVLGLVKHGMVRTIRKELSLPHETPIVAGEASTIENALLNVCINAIQAMPNGGDLKIDVTHTILDASEWGDEFEVIEGPAVSIAITDTGVGISPETLARVFDPFFTTRRDMGGTGLGLATTFGTVRNHGGAMSIQSEPGSGTTVTMTFPAATTAETTEAVPVADLPDLDGLCALVVDDEIAVRRVVCRHLASAGVACDSAGGHREALDMMGSIEHSAESYDIGVFDLSMPDGQGTDTAREFLRRWPDSTAIIISGYDVDTALVDENGFVVLQKPFTRQDLTAALCNARRTRSG